MKAYPYMHKHPTSGQTEIAAGMDLRDWFAGLALPTAIKEVEDAESYNLSDVAEIAYQYADAMMKARKEVPHE
jgi:hypothetical protein